MLHLLNALRAFEAAARLGSVRKAAEDLNVTDGAVSRHIRHLEDQLGIELFERGNRSMRLTPEAAGFAATVTEAFASIVRGSEHLRSAYDKSSIMLTAPDNFLLRWLLPRLPRLEAALDGMAVRMTTWNRKINPADPSIDVYVGVGIMPKIEGMTVVRVGPETFGPVLSPKLLTGNETMPDFLWTLPRLEIRWPPDMWINWAREAGIALPDRPDVLYDTLTLTIEAAEAGQGVAMGPGTSVSDAIRQGRLVAPLGLHVRDGCWFLAWRDDRPYRTMNAIRRWFQQEMIGTS